MKHVRFFVERSPYQRPELAIYCCIQNPDGSIDAALPLTMQRVGEDEAVLREPALRMDAESAQCLMDELYRIGIRPTDAAAPSEKAMSEHTSDLRKIVFTLLDIE